MNINSNFFNKYVNLVNEDAEFIKTVNEFEGQNENNLTEKLNQLKLLLDRLPKCTEHLKDVTWTATVIDKYEDSEILNIACIGLTNLQIEISQLKKILTSDLQKQNWDKDETEKEIRSNISNSLELLTDLFKQNGVYETAVLTTHKALDVLNPEQPALEEKSESETSSLPISNRIDHPTHGSTIQKSKTKKFLADCTKSMIFTPGKYYNPIPSKVKSYCMPEQDNSKEARKQDIIDIFKGERVLTEPKPFLESGKIIVDAVGGHVCAPEGFSKDLPRSESFHFNGVCLFDKKNREMYNPNDLARLLYREFGREGANRLMLCMQSGNVFLSVESAHFAIDFWGRPNLAETATR